MSDHCSDNDTIRRKNSTSNSCEIPPLQVLRPLRSEGMCDKVRSPVRVCIICIGRADTNTHQDRHHHHLLYNSGIINSHVIHNKREVTDTLQEICHLSEQESNL